MMIVFPDYTHSSVNLISSVLKYANRCTYHTSLPELDALFAQKSYRNIVLFLFDGMGLEVLNRHLDSTAFLHKHVLCPLFSVFPPTTTAATTSLESALTPAEHGWLGWTLYFPSLDANVNVFPNTFKDTTLQAAPYHVGRKDIPYKSVYEHINAQTFSGTAQKDENAAHDMQAYSVSRYGTNVTKTAKGMFDEVFRLCSLPGKKYIYAYHEQPDKIMHISGTYGFLAKNCVQNINRSVQRFCRRLKQNPAARDTLVLVTADHGHIPVRNTELTRYPDLEHMLRRRPSIEARAVNFFVKPEYLNEFPTLFSSFFKTVLPVNLFGTKKLPKAAGQRFETADAEFILFSRKEAAEMNLFGPGKEHPSLAHSLGDYLAVACSDLTLVDSPKSNHFKSHHAGLTAEEMIVPLIALP
ncbi:alkaline phosphatase family protein [Treponema sp. OMZ 840]|uniref:alkaline phosphatase family protein n=1 Tax=Treponema sp. OMZ 840 TaxID=244313 RepID=UPI003D91C1DA